MVPNDKLPDSADKDRQNRRLGLILASVALAFALGFVVKMTLLAG